MYCDHKFDYNVYLLYSVENLTGMFTKKIKVTFPKAPHCPLMVVMAVRWKKIKFCSMWVRFSSKWRTSQTGTEHFFLIIYINWLNFSTVWFTNERLFYKKCFYFFLIQEETWSLRPSLELERRQLSLSLFYSNWMLRREIVRHLFWPQQENWLSRFVIYWCPVECHNFIMIDIFYRLNFYSTRLLSIIFCVILHLDSFKCEE